MKRSNYKLFVLREGHLNLLKRYKKQKNCCRKLYEIKRKTFLSNLNQAVFEIIKHFRSTFSRVFSEKRKISNIITLVDDNDTIVSDDKSISEELNIFLRMLQKV